MSVLPLTVAQMLEEELVRVHGLQPLAQPHSWHFEPHHVIDENEMRDRISDNLHFNDAYTWLAGQLDLLSRSRPYWLQLTYLCSTLLDEKALKSRMISLSTRDMYLQVRREIQSGRAVDAADVTRINRTILQDLFPDEIVKVESEHLSITLDRLRTIRNLSALCLSGGGIRSATFALGVLQGLARAGDGQQYPIETVTYLSTVSGGGYIGGWLSAWIARSKGGFHAILEELRKTAKGVMGPEAAPIRWLREYSNYLAPRFSLFSVDTATLAATWLRNVLINWLIFLPFLAVLLAFPRIVAALVGEGVTGGVASLIFGGLLSMASVALIASARPSVLRQNRPERLRRIQVARFTTFFAALCMPVFWAGVRYDNVPLTAFVLFGALVQLGGATWHLLRHGHSIWHTVAVAFASLACGLAGGGVTYLLVQLPFLKPPIRWPELYAVTAPPAYVLVVLAAATTFTVLTRSMARDEVHEYWTRIGASLIIGATAYVGIAAISFYGPVLLSLSPRLIATLGGITGVVGIILGKSGVSPALEKDRGRTISDRITAVVIPTFVIILLSAISWGVTALLMAGWRGEFPRTDQQPPRTAWHAQVTPEGRRMAVAVEPPEEAGGLPPAAQDHLHVLRSTPPKELILLMFVLAAVPLITSFFADVNKFSMHGLYRMRLVRAYLGASNRERNQDPFTGFDINDSVLLVELRDQKPFHVVNMALNLVRGRRLAWQQRKASTYTASPLHWGNWQLGYRDAFWYGKPMGLDLGTAMTISGAAASPNMGYHSSPPLSFLLAMFNVRLGAWLGNPGAAGARMKWHDRLLNHLFSTPPAWERRSPKSSVAHQLAEAFGLTDDDHQYVYLSDGGHFENLGIYEMVLRRCRFIICTDAGADPRLEFDDLGNAVRKIRIDFGVPIDFKRFAMVSRDEKQRGAHCAVGRIRYSAVDGTSPADDGWLLYIKATYYAEGPQDIRQYARKFRHFPHESTADQFFTESQFESYRKLGEWVIDRIVGKSKPRTMQQLFEAAFRYQRKHAEVPRW